MTALITMLLPYFNEAAYIGATLASLAAQSDRRFQLLLIDNGSTDDSADIARRAAKAMPDIRIRHVEEPNPGKLNALRAGMAHISTPFLATCDADTIYPDHYVESCLSLFRAGESPPVAVMAIDLYDDPGSLRSRRRIKKKLWKSRVFTSQCHAGGYAQAFDVAALGRGGLLNPAWPYVLEDHEIVNRLIKHGRIAYAAHHYCFPSTRRRNRRSVGWTARERNVYRFTPEKLKDWFFYRYLGPRLAQRGLMNLNLRNRDWL